MNRSGSRDAALPPYSIIVPGETLARASRLLEDLRSGATAPGVSLLPRLTKANLQAITAFDLLGLLFDTKTCRIFAESAVRGDGSDWTLTELGLLGDVSVAVPTTIFDDGNHADPTAHDPPFAGMLVYTPGALLKNGNDLPPADLAEVTGAGGAFSEEGYLRLYERRLLPVLRFIDAHAGTPRSAIVTIPGLGCGAFAGPFAGTLGARLEATLHRILTDHAATLPNIRCVYFDPYSECHDSHDEIHGISFRVRPLRRTCHGAKSQLCRATTYAEKDDDFSGCSLYSIVAWDHVSWPGNDFYAGDRYTDDGVKAAATDSMRVITGVEGGYDRVHGEYQPPAPHRTWEQVAMERIRTAGLRLWNDLAVWQDHGR